jgi:hypothetical protein
VGILIVLPSNLMIFRRKESRGPSLTELLPSYFRCIKEYRTPYSDSISFQKGEKISVGEEYDKDPAWKGWFQCQGELGQTAWVPISYIQIKAEYGFMLCDYDAKELDLIEGEVVRITKFVNGFGNATNQKGEIGWVPLNHLERITGLD